MTVWFERLHTYAGNNPLAYTDPTGHGKKFWKKFRKIFRVIVAAVVSYFTAGAATNFLLGALSSAGTAAAGAISALGTAGGYALQGAVYATSVAVGGAVGGAVAGGIQCGTECARAGARAGAISAGIFAGADSLSSAANLGTTGRILARSTAGGLVSEANGGRFADGFRTTLGFSAAQAGFMAARDFTDSLKLKSCASGGTCAYDSSGALRTDGTRYVDFSRNPGQNGNWFTNAGMADEGSGAHMYSEDSLIGRFVNNVSKVHDFQNSWNYNSDSGLYMSRGAAFDTAFQSYSFAGMVPAAAFTGAALTADYLPYYQVIRGLQ